MKRVLQSRLSQRQYEILRSISYELKRFKCRLLNRRKVRTQYTKLHLGAGARKIPGWLNIDLVDSDVNIDIANGKLPFEDGTFEFIVSQHVIEHLTIEDELIPLMEECHRVLKRGGEMWLSTPDMEKMVRSYIDHRNADMIEDRQKRLPHWRLGEMPSQHFLNDIFHQQSEHRNLFDFELLQWVLNKSGFTDTTKQNESQLNNTLNDFPMRYDDYQSLYVRAVK